MALTSWTRVATTLDISLDTLQRTRRRGGEIPDGSRPWFADEGAAVAWWLDLRARARQPRGWRIKVAPLRVAARDRAIDPRQVVRDLVSGAK
jgi:hypothetical protein